MADGYLENHYAEYEKRKAAWLKKKKSYSYNHQAGSARPRFQEITTMSVETIQQTLRDSAAARWTVLVLVASMMFFAYMFVDILSPLETLLESAVEKGGLGWSSTNFGTYAAGEYLINVFGFLIIAGIILDRMGVRFTGLLSASLMVIGAGIKYVGISEWFDANNVDWLNSWWTMMPGSAKMAMLGFMIFGMGCEMAGTTVSKILAKWFKGKEMALAMGLEMSIARLGVFAAFWISPKISAFFATNGVNSIIHPLMFAAILLVIGLINFFVFTIMDSRFDKQLLSIGESTVEKDPEDEFHFSDLGQIFRSKMFWIIALLCVLYYSAIFPFQRFATSYFENTLGIPTDDASGIVKMLPILAMILTPFLGSYIDNKGKGASMMMLGSVIMIACHLVFAFLLPLYPSKVLAYADILVLGVSFSLVPASMWPSVPKIIDEKVLGSAYCLIFWVQNIGLCLVPLLIGYLREITGSFKIPMIVFASFGVLAFIFSIFMKIEDRKKGYGLELPNKK